MSRTIDREIHVAREPLESRGAPEMRIFAWRHCVSLDGKEVDLLDTSDENAALREDGSPGAKRRIELRPPRCIPRG